MGKIAIVTDSNSGITQKEGENLGLLSFQCHFYSMENCF